MSKKAGLILSKEQLNHLTANSTEAVAVVSMQFTILQVNALCKELFGSDEAELKKDILSLFTDDMKQLLAEQYTACYDAVSRRKDGRVINIRLTLSPIMNENGAILAWLCVLKDITAIKRRETKLVGQLAAGVAHEILNPLTTIKGFLQLFKQGIFNDNYVDTTISELRQIESFVDKLLMLANTEPLRFKPKNAITILNELISSLHAEASEHDIRIVTKFPTAYMFIPCEENVLKLALTNIMKNAMEAMPAGGKITVELQTLPSDQLVIRIIDQGQGICQERLKTLGQPFYSLHEKGIGLGLMISYKIVEEHQGQIAIKSEKGIGTTVEITLPMLSAFSIS